ncbi:MAG: hypothetical protein KAT77_05020 [Nanoarchaeota archaeon]|nr:hypothetical protein [Nanoarchaeota archaeon]
MANQLPVDQVMQLRQQGYSNNQIVDQLQRQGYAFQQIYDAMSQADLTKLAGAPVGGQGAEMPPPPGPEAAPMPEPAPRPEAQPYAQEYPAPAGDSDERISEIAEAIINEKWEELIEEVKGIGEWKDKVEANIKKMSSDLEHLKGEFSELHKGVLGKISEYDEHIRDVGSELKAIERVFKDVIPSFTENVSELSRITKGMKKK